LERSLHLQVEQKMNTFPSEVLLIIVSYILDARDHILYSRINKQWFGICHDVRGWTRVYEKLFRVEIEGGMSIPEGKIAKNEAIKRYRSLWFLKNMMERPRSRAGTLAAVGMPVRGSYLLSKKIQDSIGDANSLARLYCPVPIENISRSFDNGDAWNKMMYLILQISGFKLNEKQFKIARTFGSYIIQSATPDNIPGRKGKTIDTKLEFFRAVIHLLRKVHKMKLNIDDSFSGYDLWDYDIGTSNNECDVIQCKKKTDINTRKRKYSTITTMSAEGDLGVPLDDGNACVHANYIIEYSSEAKMLMLMGDIRWVIQDNGLYTGIGFMSESELNSASRAMVRELKCLGKIPADYNEEDDSMA
jgi:hypothetical protein